jgi:hypothetical protein
LMELIKHWLVLLVGFYDILHRIEAHFGTTHLNVVYLPFVECQVSSILGSIDVVLFWLDVDSSLLIIQVCFNCL